MATKKKIKKTVKSKPNAFETGLESLAAQQQKKIDDEEKAFAEKHPPYNRKLLVANEDSLNATVAAIGEYTGVFKFDSLEVKDIKEYISTGQLSFSKSKGLVFSVRRPVTISDDRKVKDFAITEMTDDEMADLEIDGFEIGMLVAMGRRTEIDSETIRKMTAGAVSLPRDLIGKMCTRDILSIFGLYTLFFLGR